MTGRAARRRLPVHAASSLYAVASFLELARALSVSVSVPARSSRCSFRPKAVLMVVTY